jgi:hypothetical protein
LVRSTDIGWDGRLREKDAETLYQLTAIEASTRSQRKSVLYRLLHVSSRFQCPLARDTRGVTPPLLKHLLGNVMI